jgi:hypothetical protein
VTYYRDHFVAVGDAGTILRSEDGITWASDKPMTDQWLTGVAGGDGKIVAVGYGATILYAKPK